MPNEIKEIIAREFCLSDDWQEVMLKYKRTTAKEVRPNVTLKPAPWEVSE